MELTLFDFDFTETNESIFSEEQVSKQFANLQKIFKDRGNIYYVNINDLPRDMINYIDIFEKRGWITLVNNGVNILDEHLEYHTPDEVIKQFRDQLYHALEQPNVSWYENILPVINFAASPARYKNNEVRKEILYLKDEVSKEISFKLGLKHFLEVPSSRGHKMNVFSSRWSKENVIPLISKHIIPITDYDEMKKFFSSHAFFFGRRDWDFSNSAIPIAPYSVFKRLLPNTFDLACLCEATDEKTISLILNYLGCSHGKQEGEEIKYLYPEGWSKERYESTLTEEDKQLIHKDQERLKRLHSYK